MKKILLLLIALFSVATLSSCFTVVETYKVTFNSNGGSSIPTQEVEKGQTATKPADPTKDGWEFLNWYSDETLKTIYTFSEKVDADITLYAKWEEKHVELQTIINDVNLNNNFVLYNAAKKEKENKQTEFFDRTQSYLVGIDNPFCVKPEVSFLKYNPATGEVIPTTVDSWEYDIKVSIKRGDAFELLEATNDFVEAIDKVKCTVDFTNNAVGSTFKVEVVPTGLTEKQLQSVETYTMSFTFDVTEGYNVYSTKELAYIDNRPTNVAEGNSWNEFKKANGLDINYKPSKVLLHSNLELAAEDLPAVFFYQENEVSKSDGDYDRYEEIKNDQGEVIDRRYIGVLGSLKDNKSIYERRFGAKDEFSVEGNYFTLDFSKIREVVREGGKITDKGELFSHTQIFMLSGNTDATGSLRNLNIIGNAPKEENTVRAGGAILIKVHGPRGVMYNNIATCNFITYFPEVSASTMEVDYCKGYDAYNCFIYNWGSHIKITNSEFVGAGGPVIIQDHVSPDAADGGLVSSSTVVNSKLESYVAGSEGWFVKVGATSVLGTIKSLDALFNPFGRSFLKANAKDKSITLMNFICLNKSGSSQGMTSQKVSGSLSLDDVTFDYGKSNPYLAAMIEQTRTLGTPTFQSSLSTLEDGYGFFDGKQNLVNAAQQPIVSPTSLLYQGDYLTMYYTGMMVVLGYFPAGQIK